MKSMLFHHFATKIFITCFAMYPTKPFLFLITLQIVFAKTALEAFVQKRNVRNQTITILKSDGTSNTTWIEYKYIFEANKKFDIKGKILRVGIFNDGTKENFLIIKLMKKNIESISESFKVDYIDLKQLDIINNASFTNIDILIPPPIVKHQTKNVLELSVGISSRFVLVYKSKNLLRSTDIFILTFVGILWICFLVMFVLLAISLKISTYHYSLIYPDASYWDWVDITLWAIAAACQQGLSYTPNRFASRFIFLLGYLTAYLLYTGFAAAITSLLVRQEKPQVNLMDLNENIRMIAYGTNNFPNLKIAEEVNSMPEFVNKLEGEFHIGLVPEIFLLDYFHKDGYQPYTITPINGKKFKRGVFIAKGNPWQEEIYLRLLRLEENGISKFFASKIIKSGLGYGEEIKFSSASLKHVGSALYVYLGGLIGSILFLGIELIFMMYRKYKRLYNERLIRRRASSING